jgi:hypothetical protein
VLPGRATGHWDWALAVAFLKDAKARVMFLDGNGDVSFATPILANGVRLRSAVQAPTATCTSRRTSAAGAAPSGR